MRTLILILIILPGCSSGSAENERNNKTSHVLRNSMIIKANHIEHRLNQLKDDPDINPDSIMVLTDALRRWKSDLGEAPKYKDHNHAGRDHTNNSKLRDVDEEQIATIQKELDERLSAIGKRINRLKHHDDDQEHIH